MAPPKTIEVERRVEALEKELDNMRAAIRSLSSQNNSSIELIAYQRDQHSKLQAEVERLNHKIDSLTAGSKGLADSYDLSVKRYE